MAGKTQKDKSAPAPAPAPQQAQREPAPKEKKPRIRNFQVEQKIKVLAEKNPKRAGSATAARWELYRNGMTVGEALEAGITTADLDYDNKKEFISIT